MPRRFWDRNTALRALRFEATRLGRTPTQRDLRSPDRTCACDKVYRKLFGSFTAACRAAGLTSRVRGGNPGWRKPRCHRGHDRTNPANIDGQGHCRLCAAHWASRQGRGVMRPHPQVVQRRLEAITAQKRAYWERAA